MNTRVAPSLKQLEAVYWVARLGSFQAAAARLHTTQSAVSKRIAELESLAGRPLFDRTRRTAVLTTLGQRVAAKASDILALSADVFSDGGGPDSQFEGIFRLGATELIGMTWLAKLIRRIKQDYPGARLDVEVDHGGRVLDKLNQGKFDLALVPGPMWGRLFDSVPLRTLDRCWMASPSLNVPRSLLSVEDLSSYPIASQYPETVHAQLQSAWFHQNGFLIQRAMLAQSFSVVGELVLAGLAIAQLPVQYYAPAVRDGRLVKLRTAPALPNVKYFAVYRREGTHILAEQLAHLAKELCDFSPVNGGFGTEDASVANIN